MTAPAHVLAAVRSIPHPSIPHPHQEPDMNAPDPPPAEQAVIDRFGIFEPEERGLPVEDVERVRYARFHVRVHASNRHAGYGEPVVVVARSRSEALARAIDLGWSGYRRDARVTFDRVEDIDPRECPHLTDPAPDDADGGGRR